MKDLIRRNQSWLIALAMVCALAAWMASGNLGAGQAQARQAPAPDVVPDEDLFRVRVAISRAASVTREVVLRGRTEPARAVTLRAEVDGRVVEVGPERGARVSAGEVVARIDMRDREARLAEARAAVRRYEIEFEAWRQLSRFFDANRELLGDAQRLLAAARGEEMVVVPTLRFSGPSAED